MTISSAMENGQARARARRTAGVRTAASALRPERSSAGPRPAPAGRLRSIRGTDLNAELRHEYGYQRSYPTFQRQLRLLRPAVVRDPEIRFETNPGVQTQADWAEMGLCPLGKEVVELSVIVAILGCSRAPAQRFATDQTRPTSFERLARCLDDLGGLTHGIQTSS